MSGLCLHLESSPYPDLSTPLEELAPLVTTCLDLLLLLSLPFLPLSSALLAASGIPPSLHLIDYELAMNKISEIQLETSPEVLYTL